MAHEQGHPTDAATKQSHVELTDDDLAQVVGGTGGPTGVGENNGAR